MHDIEWARNNDPIVNAIYKAKQSPEAAIVALVEQKEKLLERIMTLESIAPRKIKIGDKTYVWRCPVEFIPDR